MQLQHYVDLLGPAAGVLFVILAAFSGAVFLIVRWLRKDLVQPLVTAAVASLKVHSEKAVSNADALAKLAVESELQSKSLANIERNTGRMACRFPGKNGAR